MNLKRILVLLFGLIFLVMGIFLTVKEAGDRKTQTATATAVVSDYVIDQHEETDSTGDGVDTTTLVTYYYPVFRFTADGTEYNLQSSTGSGDATYDIGAEVTVCYNPADPTSFSVQGDSSSYTIFIVCIAVGVAAIALSVFKKNL